MVTLASDAAYDYGEVLALLEQGMECARINCAHDDEEHWRRMVKYIRRAEKESGRPCRILMDLAGHKIRTGSVELGAAIRHLKVERDAYGRTSAGHPPSQPASQPDACSPPLLPPACSWRRAWRQTFPA